MRVLDAGIEIDPIHPVAKVRVITRNYGGITRKSRTFSRVITPVNAHITPKNAYFTRELARS